MLNNDIPMQNKLELMVSKGEQHQRLYWPHVRHDLFLSQHSCKEDAFDSVRLDNNYL